MPAHKNLFATVLTHAAPSSNYRGESEKNRTVLQKISRGDKEYTVISPESMRNALRELLIQKDLPSNRSRINTEDQLAVEFKDFPNAEIYADDFLFGYMVAVTDKKIKTSMKNRPLKRDSVLRMNMAVSLKPYRFDATFHQSPLSGGKSPWKNASSSQLLHREVNYTAYQYPFALALGDFKDGQQKSWGAALVRSIGELSNVAGGHARSLYDMAPRSIVARLTPSLVAGIDTYGFNDDGEFPELKRIHGDDLPGDQFWVGGEIARNMPSEFKAKLAAEGVHFYDNPQKLIEDLIAEAF